MKKDYSVTLDIVRVLAMAGVLAVHFEQYFPIFINAEEYGETRDELYFRMKAQGIFARRYFYPLISVFAPYEGLPSAASTNLPVASKMASEVICLPLHHELRPEEVNLIIASVCRC